MKKIKLINITLRNFKGVRDFTLQADGQNIQVFGDNATGKTTLFDAFTWLLFDKDSQNNSASNFDIKTLDENGKVLHGIDHEVEASLSVNGENVALRKIFKEKWTKKRGSITSEFTGHTTDHFIDGVPVKKKEYDQFISELIDEKVFKLLTNPSYFNEQLKWQERRKTLLKVCGDITDEEVITSNGKLAKLPAILQGQTIEKHRQKITSKQKEINQELERIPVRIDEINRSLPDLRDVDKEAFEAEINQVNSQIDKKQDLISNIRNGNAIAEKKKAIQEIEMELLKIKQQHESGSKDEIYSLKARIQEEESNISILNAKLENVKNSKQYNDDNFNRIEEQLTQLRQEWHKIDNKEFIHNDQCECPTCGQSLPEEQVNEAREKALAQFNLDKSKQLEEITAKGKQGAERKQDLLEHNESLSKEYEKLKVQIAKKYKLLEKLKGQLSQLESMVLDITENDQYVEKLKEKQNIQKELQDLKTAADQSIQDIQLEIVELKSKRDHLQTEIAKFSSLRQLEARIEELQAQERQLATKYEELKQQLYLTEEFIRTKVNLLEEKINSKFKYARFKLFEQQINGGLTEVCKTTFNGVPYESGLNNAAKINIGLDIINTLSDHYGFIAPIFIDNAEAVTQLIDTDAQVVSLIVSEKDKQLRVQGPDSESDETVLNLEVI